MESVRYLFPLIILSLINPSEQGLFDYFKLEDWLQKYENMTSNVTLRSTKDYKNVTLCTLWNQTESKSCNKGELMSCILEECKSCPDWENLKETCKTELNTTIYVYHFRCLLAELLNVTSQTEVSGCENFGDEINMVIKLWNDLPLETSNSESRTEEKTIWNSIMACFLVISVFGNVIQAVHSYLQRRRYESRPNPVYINMNPVVEATEERPEQSLRLLDLTNR